MRVVVNYLRSTEAAEEVVAGIEAAGGRAMAIPLGTAKAALEQFVRYLARQLGPRGITVNAVAPGPVEDIRMADVFDDAHKRRQVAATPLGRLARPADVAQAVAFYAGADNSFMTGTTAAVNGGMSMY
ncbi:SDR family oxidoreductase [Streptomyces sp. PRKS01-29]|nr:SDR family oxidoreductase [Streptomyces sabulosicollis]MBI0296117.1 SDR family oxidoreductase [Streptomyces sabulosicollis]